MKKNEKKLKLKKNHFFLDFTQSNDYNYVHGELKTKQKSRLGIKTHARHLIFSLCKIPPMGPERVREAV